jgi:sugar/nucleoside kinase (ribokinase family)
VSGNGMIALCFGAHVLDVLARPVTEIPAGQGGALLEEIRLAPAGPAGGTAVTLSKLGARAISAGAVGDDALADALIALLRRHGVETDHLTPTAAAQTSASVLPIRPDGSRPALHVIGANTAWTENDVPWKVVEQATHVHAGAPEIVGPELCARVLERARAAGATTSADLLADGNPDVLAWVSPALAQLDHLLINDDQACGLAASDDPAEACAALRRDGPGVVVATRGRDGAVLASADGTDSVPAFQVDVVDTSGCGDAFSAGYLRGLSLGRSLRDAAVLGCATATLVAGGLGSDAGDFDLAAVEQLVAGATA